MTREQALNNLSLPADADIETIRMRFASRYTLSDTQYERTLTDGMKTLHEQHLRELEQSYKVLTDSAIIADMGSLLSLGKGYVEEGEEAIGRSDTIGAEEALAFFSLYPHDTPILAEERYQQYRDELQEAIDSVSLEATKEPFRKELIRAEECLTIAVNYLLAGHVFNQLESPVEESDIELVEDPESEIENEEKFVQNEIISKPNHSKNYRWIFLVLLALAAAVWISKGIWSPKQQQEQQAADSDSKTVVISEKTGRTSPVADKNVSASTEPKTLAKIASSPEEALENLLKKHLSGHKVNVSAHTIYIDSMQYVIPINNVDTINNEGQLVSATGRYFLIAGKNVKNSGELKLKNISTEVKKELMKAVNSLSTTKKSVQPSIEVKSNPKDTTKDNDRKATEKLLKLEVSQNNIEQTDTMTTPQIK